MNEPRKVIPLVRQWVKKAENDLRNAEYVLTMKRDCPTDTVCFHCQQCVEKYLKALLTLQEKTVPRTHDLIVLFNLLDDKTSLSINKLYPLNRYAVETRYPGIWESIDTAEAKQAVSLAKEMRDTVRNHLPPEILEAGDQ